MAVSIKKNSVLWLVGSSMVAVAAATVWQMFDFRVALEFIIVHHTVNW